MPGEFKIASGYVEVKVKPDRAQLRAAAEEAAAEFEAGSSGRYTRSGERAGRDFAYGAQHAMGQEIEKALGEAGNRGGERFVSDAEGRLRAERGRLATEGRHIGDDLGRGVADGSRGVWDVVKGLVGGVKSLGDTIGSTMSDGFNTGVKGATSAFGYIQTGLSAIGTGFSTVFSAGTMWTGLIVGGLITIPPALYAIAGALAAIPALAVGASMALGSLALGSMGIGAAIGEVFSPHGGGGGGGGNSAANRAAQLASAERNLTTAQRNAREAQLALNDARVQAAFDLEDLNLKMERQRENELGAALAIKEAQQALVQAEATGDPLQIQRAQLQVQEAVTGLKEQQQATVELSYQKQQADAKGVEGSDKVVQAMDRVQNANNAVLDAQQAVIQAQQGVAGAAGGVASAYSKLSPNAKAFVDEIRRLKPELIGLQQYVQDQLFAGLDKKLDVWAHVWIPDLRRNMGMLAGDANTFVKRLGDDLSTPTWIAAVDKVSDVFHRLFNSFTTGGTLDKLVRGFTDLVDKASPFIESLGNSAINKLGDFADSLDRAAKNGSMDRFFKEAAKDAKDLWGIASDVFSIISQIMGIFLGVDEDHNQGKNGLDGLKHTLDQISAWAHSPSGIQEIKDIAGAFHDVIGAIVAVMHALGSMAQTFDSMEKSGHASTIGLQTAFDLFNARVKSGWDAVIGEFVLGFKKIVDGAADAFGWIPGIGNQLRNARRQIDDWAAGVNNDLNSIHPRITVDVVQAIDRTSTRGNRWGGVYYAEEGLLSLGRGSAGIYPPGRPLYGFAEQDTGGELFMPRNGDQARNRALATVAAQWAGLDVVPARSPIAAGMGASGSSSTMQEPRQPVSIHVGGHHLVDLVVGVVAGNPVVVSATAAEGDRKRHFTNSARA